MTLTVFPHIVFGERRLEIRVVLVLGLPGLVVVVLILGVGTGGRGELAFIFHCMGGRVGCGCEFWGRGDREMQARECGSGLALDPDLGSMIVHCWRGRRLVFALLL